MDYLQKGGILSNIIYNNINPEANYGIDALGKPKGTKVHPLTDAGFRKYLGKEYDKDLLINNKDGSVRLPPKTERQITVDTNFIKNRINANKDHIANYNRYNPSNPAKKIHELANTGDSLYLNDLRKMYKTGEPIVVSEFQAWKDRDLNKGTVTPLNVMGNFTLKPNKQTNRIEYLDRYDLDKIPLADRIFNPFDIKGTVPGSYYKEKLQTGGNIEPKPITKYDPVKREEYLQGNTSGVSRDYLKGGKLIPKNQKGTKVNYVERDPHNFTNPFNTEFGPLHLSNISKYFIPKKIPGVIELKKQGFYSSVPGIKIVKGIGYLGTLSPFLELAADIKEEHESKKNLKTYNSYLKDKALARYNVTGNYKDYMESAQDKWL